MHSAQIFCSVIHAFTQYYVSGLAQWLGRQSLAGGLSGLWPVDFSCPIYAWSMADR